MNPHYNSFGPAAEPAPAPSGWNAAQAMPAMPFAQQQPAPYPQQQTNWQPAPGLPASHAFMPGSAFISGLYIDAENLFQNCDPASISTHIANIEAGGNLRSRIICGAWLSTTPQRPGTRGYVSRDMCDFWRGLINQHALSAISEVTTKNATDMALCIQVMDDVAQIVGLNAVHIMSADGDFTPLVRRLRSRGIHVFGYGPENAVSRDLQQACTEFFPIRVRDGAEYLHDTPRNLTPLLPSTLKLLRAFIHKLRNEQGLGRQDVPVSIARLAYVLKDEKNFHAADFGCTNLEKMLRELPVFIVSGHEEGSMVRLRQNFFASRDDYTENERRMCEAFNAIRRQEAAQFAANPPSIPVFQQPSKTGDTHNANGAGML